MLYILFGYFYDLKRRHAPTISPTPSRMPRPIIIMANLKAVVIAIVYCFLMNHLTTSEYLTVLSADGQVTTGTYYVQMADGRMQIVHYRADSDGYHANVQYEGEAKYPEDKAPPKYATSTYKAPVYAPTSSVASSQKPYGERTSAPYSSN